MKEVPPAAVHALELRNRTLHRPAKAEIEGHGRFRPMMQE
jgi:hypothetical protein